MGDGEQWLDELLETDPNASAMEARVTMVGFAVPASTADRLPMEIPER